MSRVKIWVKNFWQDEKGLGTLEILLIVAVLVGIAIIFRKSIFGWVETLVDRTGEEINQFDPNPENNATN